MIGPLDGPPRGATRRDVLRAAAGVAGAVGVARVGAADDRPAWHDAVVEYLRRLARPDGGYAWEDQADSHLTPTYAVIGCYHLLGRRPPDAARLAGFVRDHHPSRLKKLEQEHREFDFQQVQGLAWLGEDVSSFREVVRSWTRPKPYLKQYERHGYPVFRAQLSAFTCRVLLGLSRDDLAPHFTRYLHERRRANGSFNNTTAADGGDGHVMNTLWGLEAMAALGGPDPLRGPMIEWLRACQLPGGGFTYQPRPELAGVDDVAYTRAAVRALTMLGSGPADRGRCLDWLHALRNEDGGFGDRPGWSSNPLSTYHALDALEALGALDAARASSARRPSRARALPGDLKVFSAQVEAHGKGSPADAVTLAGALRIHLWGAKNPGAGWVDRAQEVARARGVPVTFCVADEEYGTWIDFPGLGTYSHMSDLDAPAGAAIGPSLAGPRASSWAEFRDRRLAPLRAAGGHLVWQFGENEELVRLVLDDAIERGGYAAISTYHFGNPDFTNTEPFLNRYRGRIPFIALQDAHGDEPWWFSDMTTGFRTLFLAREPTWAGWSEALRENRVVAVRRDAWSGHRLWTHAGSREIVEFVMDRQAEWRWWDNPGIRRPMASIAVLTPESRDEAGRPEAGVAIRVRCARDNTAQGRPRDPIAELVRLVVDGETVRGTEVRKMAPAGGRLLDHYHVYALPATAAGRHAATAVIRRVRDGSESSETVTFTM